MTDADRSTRAMRSWPPSALAQWFFRAPKYLYQLGLGWMLGKRMVLVEHTGRKSGQPRQTVLEVVRRDEDGLDVAAAWGPKSDWYRNIVAEPKVTISTGRIRDASAQAAVVDRANAESVYADYTRLHPRAAKALTRSVGVPLDDPGLMAETVPLVRIEFAPAH